ncbi:winged helix-turn-helix domain-containing protein [Streptomyces albidoflavus]|uniref:winged helix-turn-helix domain-containing protein n=1 Tax=Streptomyces albidoflavus TaxID=1886 RepID=UPI0033D9BC3D
MLEHLRGPEAHRLTLRPPRGGQAQGWSPQVPAHRAVERDEQAVERWRTEQWSRVRGRLSS